jgi:hypothetical protein
MTELNIHSSYIDKRIRDIENSTKWNSKFIDTSHEEFIRDYSVAIFVNIVRSAFSITYVKQFMCSDCGQPSQERCHGIGDERPILLRRALEKVWSDTSKPITMKKIIIAFLEEHKYTKFTFKCRICHRNEEIKTK